MALKDQPYIPLYVQDVLTDEKLIECSAKSQGVFLRLMCVLHKQENYGKFLLKQKYKQTEQQVKNFALSLVRPLAFDIATIHDSLIELIDEEVLFIDGDFLCQKRMIKDAELSEKRAKAGRKGGVKSSSKNKTFDKKFAQAKTQANTEYENEVEYEYEIDNENEVETEKNKKFTKNDFKKILMDLGSDETHVDDWLKVRANKKSSNTQTALKTFVNECNKHNYPVADAVKICAENSWAGFKYEWINNLINNSNGNRNNTKQRTDSEIKRDVSRAVDKLFGVQ